MHKKERVLPCTLPTKTTWGNFQLTPIVTALLAMHAGLNPTWAAEECGPAPAGTSPALTCSGDFSPGGIHYIGGTIPQGLHLTLEPHGHREPGDRSEQPRGGPGDL